jgi:hypothetical protein
MESDDALKRKIQSYAPTLEPVYRLRDQMIGDAPYLRDIGLQRQDQGNYSDIIDLIKKNLFPSKPEGVKMRTQMRRQLNEMARQDKLTGTVGMLQHLPADQVAKADFIDLSNVPEYDLEFPIQPFLDMVNKGAYVYFAEINNKNPIETKASMLPIEQVSKSTVDTVLTPTSDVNQRTSFYLFKKK